MLQSCSVRFSRNNRAQKMEEGKGNMERSLLCHLHKFTLWPFLSSAVRLSPTVTYVVCVADYIEDICPYATFQLSKPPYSESTYSGNIYSGPYHSVRGSFVYHDPKPAGAESYKFRQVMAANLFAMTFITANSLCSNNGGAHSNTSSNTR